MSTGTRVTGLTVVVAGMVERVDLPIFGAQVTLGTFSRPVPGDGVARTTGAIQTLMHEGPTDGGVTF